MGRSAAPKDYFRELVGALPNRREPFTGHDQFRANDCSCQKLIEVRKPHTVTGSFIGHQKLVQFIDHFRREFRCVYHEGGPMRVVLCLATLLQTERLDYRLNALAAKYLRRAIDPGVAGVPPLR